MTKQPNIWQRALTGVNQALNQTFSGAGQQFKDNPLRAGLTLFTSPGLFLGQSYKTGRDINAPDPNIPDFYTPINAMQNTGLQSQPFSPSIKKGDYGTSVYDIQNTISPMQGSGLSYGVEEQAPTNAMAQQPAQMPSQPTMPTMPKVAPQTMPYKMPSDLNYIYGADQSAFQNIDNTFAPPVNAMTKNGGYFDMDNAGTVGGNWVEGAGWMTQADQMFGKTEEDLAFEAEMRRRMASLAQ